MIRRDGLQDLLGGFNEAGAEDSVESWVGTGPNHPTDAGQVESAVGRTRTEAMASALGVAPDTLAAGLARLIPAVVDHLTPGARLPSGADLDAMDLSGIDAAALLR